jgi:hypothetical protein
MVTRRAERVLAEQGRRRQPPSWPITYADAPALRTITQRAVICWKPTMNSGADLS